MVAPVQAPLLVENTLTVDFETYWDQKYSLSKITTSEYVNDEQFEVILVAVKVNNGKTVSFSGTFAETEEWLSQFPWDKSVVIMHNALFDGSILEWRFGIKPHRYFCTMMAGQTNVAPFIGRVSLAKQCEFFGLPRKGDYAAVHGKGKKRWQFSPQELADYTDYCINDVERTYDLYRIHRQNLPKKEKELLHFTITKFTRSSLYLDPPILRHRLHEIQVEKATVLMSCNVTNPTQLRSNPRFAKILEELGVEPPVKISPVTGKETFAFAKNDVGMQELLEHSDPRVQAVVAARLKMKSTLEESRLERFIKQAELGVAFAIPLMYYAAHTGRLGGLDKLNLQNLPRGGSLRKAIIAAFGFKIVAGDLSQIEARILATLAGQWDLVQDFANGVDVYRQLAAQLFQKAPEHVTDDERFIGKQCILSMGYGTGGNKFYLTMKTSGKVKITEKEAFRIVKGYRNKYHLIPAYWRRCETLIEAMLAGVRMKMGPIRTMKNALILPNGMLIHYPGLRRTHDGGFEYHYKGREWRNLWGGSLCENIVQALARIIIRDAELLLAKHDWPSQLQIHDELLYTVVAQKAERFKQALEKALVRPVKWLPNLPIACEVKIGDNYAECK